MPTILENLIKLREIIAATPENGIDLDQVVTSSPETECGAIACVVGTAALHPYFHAQGLRWACGSGLTLNGEPACFDDERLQPIFGRDPYGLFNTYGCGMEYDHPQFDCVLDGDLCGDIVTDLDTGQVMSHKELALWRLDQRIRELS